MSSGFLLCLPVVPSQQNKNPPIPKTSRISFKKAFCGLAFYKKRPRALSVKAIRSWMAVIGLGNSQNDMGLRSDSTDKLPSALPFKTS
jgi:hypothetical protein